MTETFKIMAREARSIGAKPSASNPQQRQSFVHGSISFINPIILGAYSGFGL